MYLLFVRKYVTINVLFRCFHTADANDLVLGYTYFVRPVLEYCSTVLNPFIHAIHDIGMTDEPDKVKRYFTRRLYYRCHLDCNHGYAHSNIVLKLETLEIRRICSDMTVVFKIVHKQYL